MSFLTAVASRFPLLASGRVGSWQLTEHPPSTSAQKQTLREQQRAQLRGGEEMRAGVGLENSFWEVELARLLPGWCGLTLV